MRSIHHSQGSGYARRRSQTFLSVVAVLAVIGTASTAASKVPVAKPVPNIDAPATLGPTATPRGHALPVESLRAIHSLDLAQPPQAELPELKVARRRVEPAMPLQQPSITMPALVAPNNAPTSTSEAAATPTEVATAPTEDAPPAAPERFQPEWRPSGKGKTVAEAFDGVEIAEESSEAAADPDRAVAESEPKQQAAEEEAPAASTDNEQVATSDITPEPAEVEPAKPLKPLSRNQMYLRNKLRRVLTYYYRKPLNSAQHDAWEAMHGMLAYGLHSRIKAGGPRGESMTAIGWLCYNNACERKQLMRLNEEGKIRALYGVGLQGHMGQFLAMLAQCNVDPSYPIRVEGKEFTIEDLIASEQETCYANTELTFKLIGLMHYLPSDAVWVNDQGEEWSFERLIEEELKQPIRGAACGGTHRLGGLSLAVKKRLARGEPLDGAYLKAAQFTNKYEQYAYRLQNSDGSFSTEWFRGPGREKDINRRCRTSGHLLEWILYQVDEDELTSYRVVKGVNYLTNLLYSESDNEWEIGPLCHALHALTLYDQMVFQPHDKPTQTASKSGSQQGRSQATSNNGSARRTSSGYRSR